MNAPSSVFAALNQYFDKIYVVTLDGYEDRQQSIRTHFKGLDYHFWPGTDKRKLSDSVLKDKSLYDDEVHKSTKRTSRSMILGEYACASSHRRIYEDVVENNYERVLILEDDATPNLERLSDFSRDMSTLPDDWDVVMLGYYNHHLPSFKTSLKQTIYRIYKALHIANWHKVPTTLIDRLSMLDYNKDFYLAGKLFGTHAYAISNKAAKAYVEYQTPIILQADRIFYYYSQYEKLKEFAPKHPMFGLGEVSEVSTIFENKS